MGYKNFFDCFEEDVEKRVKEVEYGFSYLEFKNIINSSKTSFKLNFDIKDDSSKLDLSDKNISLVCITSTNIVFSVLSYLLCMKDIKFTNYLFFTDKVSFSSVNLLKDIGVNVIKIDEIDFEGYNYFRLFEIQRYIENNFCLFIEHDSCIYDVSIWKDEYLKYDYVGATWPLIDNKDPNIDTRCFVGNGGFSIVSKNFMDLVLVSKDFLLPYFKKYVLLDTVLCRIKCCNEFYERSGIKKPPVNNVKDFSFESPTLFNSDVKSFFGIHLTGRKMLAHKYMAVRGNGIIEPFIEQSV